MKRKNKNFAFIFSLIILIGTSSLAGDALAFDASTITNAGLFVICPACSIVTTLIQTGNQMASDISTGFFNFVLSWLSVIPSALLGTGQALLSWVISPNFLGISMTGPDNVVVSYGWAITRDLANIFLLLALVVIGLGIILGIEEYQAKKTLPKLIAIALLINFTLVICGFILDFANLLMNYLLGVGSLDTSFASEIQGSLAESANKKAFDNLGIILIYFIFGVVAAVIYFLYALLFIARYVYLWILIIVSPIAFVTKAFPSLSQAKQFFPSFFHWDKWWEDFIRWSVVGIYAAFFIGLANRLMTAMAGGKLITSSPSILGNLFSYLFPLALLLVGFFSILEQGSSVPGFKKVGEYAKRGLTTTATVAAGAIAGAAAGAYVGAEGSGKDGKPGTTRQQFAGAVRGALTAEGREKGIYEGRKYLERIPVVGRALGGPGAASAAKAKDMAEAEKAIKDIPKTKDGTQALIRMTEKPAITKADYRMRLKAIQALAERKELPDEVVAKNAAEYQRSDQDINVILKADPAFARHFANPKTGTAMTTKEAVDRFDGKELAKSMQKSAVDSYGKTGAERGRIEETVLAITANQMNFNAMKGLGRQSKIAFANTLRSWSADWLRAHRGRTALPTPYHGRVLQLSDPKWQ